MATMERYLKIDGKYHYESDTRNKIIMNEVAICFDRDSRLLLDHGDPEEVIEYYEEALKDFKEADWAIAANDITMVVAKFPIRELNKLMLNKKYLSGFLYNNKDLFSRDVRENG